MSADQDIYGNDETARRVRAAISYGDLSRAEAAEALGVSTRTLDRIMGKGGRAARGADLPGLWRLADACGMPREWFSVNMGRLGLAVDEGGPTFTRPSDDPRQELEELLEDRAAERGPRTAGRGSPPARAARARGGRREAG